MKPLATNAVRAIVAAGSLLLAPTALGLSVVGMPAAPRTDAERSCYELSAEVTRLSRIRRGTAGFWGRTENQAAAVFTAIYPLPAIGYLGYKAYEGFKQDQRAEGAAARIEALRHELARKQCFVK